MLFISAGFDAHRDDPLGRLKLTEDTYETVLRRLLLIQPKIALVLEGGYHLDAIGRCAVRTVETLLGDG